MNQQQIHYGIAELVPHSGTMSLLDEVLAYDDDSLTARVSLSSHSLFAEPEGVPAWIGVEYMAQAVAAYAGIIAKAKGEAITIGFLVGTRKYQCDRAYFPLGCDLIIHVDKELQGENGLGVFNCRINIDNSATNRAERTEPSASASLNVFQPHNVDDFLQQQ